MPELISSQVVEDSTPALFISQNFQGGESNKNAGYNLPGLDWNVWIRI